MIRLDRITMTGFKSFAGKTSIPFPEGFNCVCGPNGSGKCLGYDSIVFLADGSEAKIGDLIEDGLKNSRNIKKLDDGMYSDGENNICVLALGPDLRIQKRRVKDFIKRKAPEKMLKIITRSGREVMATPYHPFFTIKKSGIESLKAEELKTGVKVAVPRKLPISGNADNLSLEGMRLYVPFSTEIKSNIKELIRTSGLTQKQFAQETEVPFNAIKGLMDGQSMRYDYLTSILPDFYENDLFMKSKNQKKIARTPSVITPEIARFLGYIISEGRLTSSNQVWFVNNDADIIEDFVEITRNAFGLEAKIFEYKTGTKDVIIFSKPLEVYLETVFGLRIGSKSYDKAVPDAIKSGSLEIITNFLSSLFDGDGYLHCKGRRAYLEYSTASRILASGVQMLLLRLGILSNIKKKEKCATNTKEKVKRTYYSVYVYGSELRKLLEFVDFRHAQKSMAAHKIKEIRIINNPNTDLIPNVNGIIKVLIKKSGISVKNLRKRHPKLAAYYEDRCECSRAGIKEVIGIVDRYGTKSDDTYNIIYQLLLLAESDILWDEVADIKEVERPEWVYDLTVDGLHNFIADGFFAHNSNIIDALTFVLGTSSARAIRAQKLQNLLFNGGRDRKPADYCEVSLYLNNSDSTVKGYEKEIKITRRITRSGISAYKLDGRNVTRSKILDLLANTGLSPDGFNIIMQGDVTEVIEMSHLERKGIINDISGIAEFDEKKEKAGRELEKVENRVRENMIVVAEKQRLVSRLRQEKDTAEKYQQLERQLRSAKASLVNRRISDAQEKLSAFERDIKDNEGRFNLLEKDFKETESLLEEKEKALHAISDSIIQKSRNYEIMKKADSLRTEIIRKKDRVEMLSRDAFQERNAAVRHVLSMKKPEIHGTFASLVSVPKKYTTALEVAIGRHADDIIASTDDIAVECIKDLKQSRAGRARFLSLNRMESRRQDYRGREKVIGHCLDLIGFDKKYYPAVSYVLGSTAVVKDIDTAKKIHGYRTVTLDGDLAEKSGAMIGGFDKAR